MEPFSGLNERMPAQQVKRLPCGQGETDHAPVAQRIEQWTSNPQAAGSIPAGRAKQKGAAKPYSFGSSFIFS